MRTSLILALAALAIACSRNPEPELLAASTDSIWRLPNYTIGDFDDDYGSHHTISTSEWIQHPANRYRIVRWHYERNFLIAQNDSANPSAPGKWTRIDWVRLQGMAPYEWAFCFSSFDALSAQAAESVTVARPATPRTGCNGYPYTRMRRRSDNP